MIERDANINIFPITDLPVRPFEISQPDLSLLNHPPEEFGITYNTWWAQDNQTTSETPQPRETFPLPKFTPQPISGTPVPPTETLNPPTPTPYSTETPQPSKPTCNKEEVEVEFENEGRTAVFVNTSDENECFAVFAAYDTQGYANLQEGPQKRIDFNYDPLRPGETAKLTLNNYYPEEGCYVQLDAMAVRREEDIPEIVPEILTAENQGPQWVALIKAITQGWRVCETPQPPKEKPQPTPTETPLPILPTGSKPSESEDESLLLQKLTMLLYATSTGIFLYKIIKGESNKNE